MERTDRIYVPPHLRETAGKAPEVTEEMSDEQKIALMDKIQTEGLRWLPLAPFAIAGVVALVKAIAG